MKAVDNLSYLLQCAWCACFNKGPWSPELESIEEAIARDILGIHFTDDDIA